MNKIDFADLSKNNKREIISAHEEAGTPVAQKSGNGYKIVFIPDAQWDLFVAQRRTAIERGEFLVIENL